MQEHVQALGNAIARLGDVYEGENDGEPPFPQGQSTDHERRWRKRQYNPGGVIVFEGSNGDKLPRKTSGRSEHPYEVGNQT
ncbi:hypothetical protein Fmac_022882 [Flemingia macrophylla]|uniref:Uncharacterized protein n=1 Tax=Flemingia macrophylla TaxID=520843 RepID=A0ABD1LJX8_9FABA